MQRSDGMNYAPKGKPKPVVRPGEFVMAAAALDHGHIYGMTNGLLEAGAELRYVYDPDPAKVEAYRKQFPQAKAVRDLEEILADPAVHLVTGAAVPSERCALGLKVMDAGKDYFTDKTPFTTLEQIVAARAKIAATGRKYMVYFSERLHVESTVFAGQLVADGVIGDVIQVLGMGPHRLSAPTRPDWFFRFARYGGILCDIGSHQIEQFLFYTGARDAEVLHSKVANYANPQYPELEDYGDCTLLADNGATNYFQVHWFTPDGLATWGDGRLFLLGTKGYIEVRKYIDAGGDGSADNVLYVTERGQHYVNVHGQVGFPFFGEFILDCINRTEQAMTQEHALKAAELCVRAQMQAVRVKG